MKILRTFESPKRDPRNTKRVPYALKYTQRYLGLVLWFFRISDQTHFKVLMSRVEFLYKHSGVKFVTLFLKEALRLVQHWKSGNPTVALAGGPRVASRRGLPLIIPGPLRLLIEGGDKNSLRAVLTLISIFRVFKYKSLPKLSTITDPFKGICDRLSDKEVETVFTLFRPFIPYWVPIGRSRLIPLRSAGPNNKVSILGAPMDALAWLDAPKELLNAYEIISNNFGSKLAEMLHEEMNIVKDLIVCKKVDTLGNSNYTPILGKLSLKMEAAGKVRVFAIVDVWTQSILEPIHEYIYSILRNIPQDGTFDQSRPLSMLRQKISDKPVKTYSYDLSAATDRLPLALQVQVLGTFLNKKVAEAWGVLLSGRIFWLKDDGYKYAVGQPMGALSSFGMLALTHHYIVQYAA